MVNGHEESVTVAEGELYKKKKKKKCKDKQVVQESKRPNTVRRCSESPTKDFAIAVQGRPSVRSL